MQSRLPIIITICCGILGGVVLIILGITGVGYARYRSVIVPQTPIVSPAPNASPTPTPDPLAPEGILLMGFGGAGHDGGYLTDTMILAYIEHRAQRVTLISFPRDLWVELPTSVDTLTPLKLNAAYAIGRDDKRYPNRPPEFSGIGGGGALAKTTIAKISGLPVDHFVALSFTGFEKAIDELGGISVNNPIEFEDPYYPIKGKEQDLCEISAGELEQRTATLSGVKLEHSFDCRYETLHFPLGTQLLDGKTALAYVRSRHSETYGGDFSRSQRQKAVISAIRSKLTSTTSLPNILPFLSKLSQDMQTDIDPGQIATWMSKTADFSSYSINSITLSDSTVLTADYSTDRQYILRPTSGMFAWEQVQQFIQSQLRPEASTAATPTPTSVSSEHDL